MNYAIPGASLRVAPSREQFRELADRGNVIAVWAEFIADCETPVSAFTKLGEAKYSFLFESTERNEISGRFSFLGAEPRLVVKAEANRILIREQGRERRLERTGDPLEVLRELMSRYRFVSSPSLPRFCGGAVGYFGYEVSTHFQPKAGAARHDELGLPEMMFMITSSLLVFDHRRRSLTIVVNVFREDGSLDEIYEDAVTKISQTVAKLGRVAELPLIETGQTRSIDPPRSNCSQAEFEAKVAHAKEYIAAGDIFQVVLSQRFETDFQGDPFHFYRCLRFINPSPYMFCLKFGDDFALVGSSPEMHVRVIHGAVEIRPIAGTRPRGTTAEQDEQFAAELLADEKERAEHTMLVDLARNDIGRISEYGSVRVTELMNIERYSHVMHIVSNVTGKLRPQCDAYEAIRATFPAGTVSGAPKIRAMQIIGELEGTRRGCYAGAVGYIGFDGNLDSCITLRSAVLKNGKAYFQAGAGIVADSNPCAEYEETVNKARAIARALALANS
ncbi:MAG: anthranilate synthase component I [Verrucomicrobia bacterium]|nr:anthranilate synthase component I [Verrucomicrobiota bacterium]